MDLSDRPGRSLPVSESTLIPVQSSDFSDLYNLSKLMGESIGLAHGKSVRVARLSNVVGPDFDSENFLISVLKDCILKGHVTLRTSLQSGKDYISIDDVSSALLQIGPSGKSPIYNIASGKQTTNAELVRTLTELTGATFSVAENSPTIRFPAIDNGLAARELGLAPVDFQSLLPALVQQYHELRDISLKINQTDRTGLLRRSA